MSLHGTDGPPSAGSSDARSALQRCLTERGYTPPVRALPELIAALGPSDEATAELLERAIARAGAAAVHAALVALGTSSPEQRPPVLSLLARLASAVSDGALRVTLARALCAALGESVPASRKWAARALGKLGEESAEPELLQALARSTKLEQKSLVDALGSVGGAASLSALRAKGPGDTDFERRRERALTWIERRQSRSAPGAIALDRALAAPSRIALSCRAGLEQVLARELSELGLGSALPAATSVEIEYAGTLRELLRARTALDVGLVLELDPAVSDPSERIAVALTSRETLARVARWTEGLPRFRVAWQDGGHHRASAWALAEAVRRRTRELVNDSEGALWTLRARSDAAGRALLVPRLDPDPRFSYRVSQVPAASHPTIAAALARVAGVQADEVVWDPFVGSGLELVERARLGEVRELWGSDIDAQALVAARANLAAAGCTAPLLQLVQTSALELAPPGVSLIITNPPMGRRLARDGSLGPLLESFVRHAATVLRPAGRLVWLSPLGKRTERVAHECGLHVRSDAEVDLGGFSAVLQVLTRGV